MDRRKLVNAILIKNNGKEVGWYPTDTTDAAELEKECKTAVNVAYALGCPFRDEFTAVVGRVIENAERIEGLSEQLGIKG